MIHKSFKHIAFIQTNKCSCKTASRTRQSCYGFKIAYCARTGENHNRTKAHKNKKGFKNIIKYIVHFSHFYYSYTPDKTRILLLPNLIH